MKLPNGSWRYGAVLLVAAVLLYVVLPQFRTFGLSVSALKRADPVWLLAALLASLFTYLLAALKYQALAFRPLQLGRTTLVQLAGMLANRLLPAGVGAMGVNFLYLRRARHTREQAAAAIGLNTVLGFVGHAILVAGLLMVYPASRKLSHLPALASLAAWWPALIAAGLGLAAVYGWFFQARLRRSGRQLLRDLARYRQRPGALLLTICYSMLLAIAYAAVLACAVHAVGWQMFGFVPALVVLTFGVAASAVTPTPGGLGGVEAGLVLGMVGYGASASLALAAALVYRFFTFWLALACGAMAFVYAQRRGYFAA